MDKANNIAHSMLVNDLLDGFAKLGNAHGKRADIFLFDATNV